MARQSLIQREKKRQKLEQKYHLIRQSLKKELRKVPSLSDKWEIYRKLQSPPRNSTPTRLSRRCFSTERPRAYYQDFGLSGHILREMVHACFKGLDEDLIEIGISSAGRLPDKLAEVCWEKLY
ncbi:hypothetical protein MKX03_029957 [Papaver bracteatum]|nr:hypothetical protein MKX03_029957 [Papaver bracteatum]